MGAWTPQPDPEAFRWVEDERNILRNVRSDLLADLTAAVKLLNRVIEIVPDEAMMEEGEDPHPPSVLRQEIEDFLTRRTK